MTKKYVLRINETWTEYNKLWPAIQALRDYLKGNLTFEPQNVRISLVDLDHGYFKKDISLETILRGVLWTDAQVPVEWTGSITANIVADAPIVAINEPAIFSSTSTSLLHHIVKYEWSYNGGATWEVGGRSYTHIFTTPGTYQVVLRITDDGGDRDKSRVLNYVVT